ncbi:hypothetical protein KCH_30050 [Kitasatospora cheerisanensis KCTC 2395]|uniref:Uncharacterized protein n=1 Tax=Kitasatospora cheerisanensis KCTC 2395 TaxID=1348663 RepID=A0A066Z4F1_9ACTN|nr:hypothetical protein KCH_30050 [Kitasatospora cheerisanensis KCTC 2395]
MPALGGGLAGGEGLELLEHGRVLHLQPFDELAEGDHPDLGLVGDRLQGLLDGVHVDAAVPALEVVADDERGPVAVVGAVEAGQVGVPGLGLPEGAAAGVALGVVAGLVVHDVVVHREHLEGVPGERDGLQRHVPERAAGELLRPHLQAAGARTVVLPAALDRGGQQAALALQAGGAAADEFLAVVEGEGREVGEAGVGLPVHDEVHRLLDLAVPVLGGPAAAAVGAAEVPVEVGADLVAVQPGGADLLDGGADVLVAQVADVGGADGVLRRVVHRLLRLGQGVDAGEEEGHGGVVVLGELPEPAEQAVVELARAVPGEHHELRGLLAGFERFGGGLVGLRAGVGGGAVADQGGGGPGDRGAAVRGEAVGLGGRGGAPAPGGARAAGREGGGGRRTGGQQRPAGEGVHVSHPFTRE